jgi:type II secretory pathway pseudopilin PulG
VVIIIGILMGIAVPVYLNQRVGAQDAAARANLRQAATAEQAYRTANNAYTGVVADLQDFGYNEGVPPVTFSNVTGTTICAQAVSQSTATFHMTEDSGTPQNGPCV